MIELQYPSMALVFTIGHFVSVHKAERLFSAYLENTNFETYVPINLKLHTFGGLYTTKKC